jgi:hypothetical protein
MSARPWYLPWYAHTGNGSADADQAGLRITPGAWYVTENTPSESRVVAGPFDTEAEAELEAWKREPAGCPCCGDPMRAELVVCAACFAWSDRLTAGVGPIHAWRAARDRRLEALGKGLPA